jgi:segregation and condensation protein A
MAMAEKTVPWWRRALEFALGGIRSGFGLFQRGAKPGNVDSDDSASRAEAKELASENRLPLEVVRTQTASNLEKSEAVSEKIKVAQIQNAEIELEPAEIERAEAATDDVVPTDRAVEVAPESVSDVKTEQEKTAEEEIKEEPAGIDEIVEEPVIVKPISEEKTTEQPPHGDPHKDEPVREEPPHEDPVRDEPTHDEPVRKDPVREEPNVEEPTPDEEFRVQPHGRIEEPRPSEPAADEGKPEAMVPVELLEEQLKAERRSEAAAAPAQASDEFAEEWIEISEPAEPNLEKDAAIEEQINAIKEPLNHEGAEELETVETEATVVTAEPNEPTEERAEKVNAVEARAEEPAALEQSAEPVEAKVEEPAQEDEIEVTAPSGNEPVIAGIAEAQEELIVELVPIDIGIVGQAANEEVIGTQTAEALEESGKEQELPKHANSQERPIEEPALVEPEVVEEAASNEAAGLEAAESGEAHIAEGIAEESLAAEHADAEAATVDGSGTLVVAEAPAAMSEAREIEATAGPETVVEAAAEAVAAPAQMELIPKPLVDEKAAAKKAEQEKRRKEAEEDSPFSVMVGQVYDGPLDLLLDLIRKQDIDIYDIPIAKITAQFLAYVNQLKASDVDVAGEFIYTASLLIHIKSKMLLPRTAEAPGEAPEDPRRELVERLLEHERFKNAAQMLQQKQMMEAASWSNPGYREFVDDEGAEPEIAADTVDLVRVFREILERARNRPVLDVAEDTVTVGQMIQFLGRRLTMEDKPIPLRKLLSHTRSERALIAMFLALLELVRLQAVLLRQDKAFSEIFIKKHAGFEAVMDEGLANVKDDWR